MRHRSAGYRQRARTSVATSSARLRGMGALTCTGMSASPIGAATYEVAIN